MPKGVVADWLSYLRQSAPTVAFKAGTQVLWQHEKMILICTMGVVALNTFFWFRMGEQEQKSGLSQHAGDAEKAAENVLSRSGSVGTEALLQLLKNYCRNLDIKTVSTVL